MGTFHHGKSELHGITLALRLDDAAIIGRCDDMDADHAVLVDAVRHDEGQDGRSVDAWLERAAKFGISPQHGRLTVAMTDVRSFAPLSEFYRGVGAGAPAAKPEPAPRAAPSPGQTPAPTGDELVHLTDAARTEVRRILDADGAPDQAMRLGVTGGGCSGLVYKAELDTRKDGDVVVECGDVSVILDRKSSIYLRGVTLDHQGGLEGRGFQFRNPNATNTCGCGESFSV